MDVTVQLTDGGQISTMDDSQLERRDSVVDNEHEHTEVTEYFLPGDQSRAVHRSVHVTLKEGLDLTAAQGQISGE